LDKKKRTPLYEEHVKLGARIIDFAGWEMPVKYDSIIEEHKAVRNHVGIFDISHMGEYVLKGSDIIDLLQYLMVNDLKLLEPSKGQYSCMCYENGTVVDDMVYYEETPEKFRMVVNASNRQKDFDWIQEHIGGREVKVKNVSDERCRIAYQGPDSEDLLQELTDIDLSTIERFYFAHVKLKDMPIFIARTGYTGEQGFELSFAKEYAKNVWNILLDTGAKPAGLGARDSLRLEACYSLYGHEISDEITPIEAGLNWLVKKKEGMDYIGKDILMKQKEQGTSRTLVGLNLKDRGIIRENYKLFKDDQEIGFVTSGGYSPTLEKTIGLALVQKEYSEIGTEMEIEVRGRRLTAEVVSTPFYRNV
jgi:aminomethyltransferase